MAAALDEPRVVRSVTGRARVHLPRWSGAGRAALERRIRALPGVRRADANALTRNVLIRFDPAAVPEGALVAALAGIDLDDLADAEKAEPSARGRRVALSLGQRGQRLRIAVRGLDRDIDLCRRVVERLERHPHVVRAAASPLTGRVLVELAAGAVDLEDLLAEIEELEPPETDEAEIPSHPLDPAPLIQSSARMVGASLGLGLLAVRRMAGAEGPPVAAAPAAVAGAVGIVEGLPPVHERVEGALGRDGTQLLFGALTIVSLTFSGGALGLAAAGAAALGLMSDVRARRSAWSEYEQRAREDEPVHPGVCLRLDPGARVPLTAEVIEGFGRAVAPDGSTLPVAPGAPLPGGARVYGPAITVRLGRDPPSTAPRRRQPPAPSGYDRYLKAIVPLSLAYGAVLGLVRGSLRWAFGGLLLANPRAALWGARQADRRASARVL